MAQSSYTIDQERQINSYLKKMLDVLGVEAPDDHFGSIELFIPRQNGKIAGEIDVKLKQKFKRQKTE